jgi:hypothetical protein
MPVRREIPYKQGIYFFTESLNQDAESTANAQGQA